MADNIIPTWEESAPVENNSVIPTWEESAPVENRLYSPTKKNFQALISAFGGDPLSFIDDPQIKADLEFATGRLDNPETERKKWALAAYFSQMRKDEIQFCHANIDTLLEQFYGKKISVDEAYNDRAVAFRVREPDKGFWESSTAGAVIEGSGQIAKGTFNAFGFLGKLFAMDVAIRTRTDLARINPEAVKLIRDPLEAGEMAESSVRGVYKKYYEPIRAWGEENMALPADWMTNSKSFGDWCRNATIAIVNYLPQLAAQTGLMVATGGVSSLATVYGINGYYEIKDDHPEMSEGEAIFYGVGIGLINGGLEKITLGIIKGKVSREFAKEGIKKGLLQAAKHFGWAGAKEGFEEAAEQMAENLLDIKMGLRGDTKNWKASDYWREMKRGVPESAFLGAVTGAPLAADSYVSARQIAARQDKMRVMVQAKVQELSGKENLSPEEAAELEKLKVVDDAGNTADVVAAAQEIYQKEIIRQREAAEQEAELTDEELTQKNADDAQQNFRMRNKKLQHNPQETIDTANELMQQFPNIKLDVVYSAEELPADVKSRIAEDDLDVSLIRAWVDDSDTVHLVASNVRPSEVARTLGHEIIGHKGLRAVFGEQFDSFLDQVYRDHFEEVAEVAQRYHRDTETVENQRYLTEEFLAECANAEIKPSWWKEFLGFIRRQLRKIFPKMRFSDADIEAALSLSARAMRRRSGESKGLGVRFAVDFNNAVKQKFGSGNTSLPQVDGKQSAWAMDGTFENPIRFSVAPQNENLIVMHNVSAANLRKAAKLGGLPVPSLAIVDSNKSDFSSFGEISLVADKSLIDPKVRGNKVFNADIYSARVPQSKKFYSDEDYSKAERILSKYDGGKDDEKVGFITQRFRTGMYDSDLEDVLCKKTYAALNWYCQDHGMKTPEGWQEQNEIRYSNEFREWWETSAVPQLGLDPEEKMYAGTTNSGRKKWIPFNLENVVKAMTKKVRNAEGFFYGIGNIRSMKALQFKSIAQIQKQRDKIVSAETMKKLKEEVEAEFKVLSSRMESASNKSKFGWEFNTAEDCLLALAEGGYDNIKYLQDRFGDNKEIFREMAEFLDKLVNMPAEYFEAKPQRAVGLGEFKAAIIPDDAPADVRQLLEDAGVQIYTYGKTPRKAAVQMATMDNRLRFSLGEYSEADQKDIVAILKPYTGQYVERNPEDYAKYLAEKGVNIPAKDAWLYALEACRENQKEARRRERERRDKWLYENTPFYREVVDFCGEDFIIKPSFRFSGEAFSGAWISPEFVKYSEKRLKGRKESDSSYRRYLAKRERALANATGHDSDEIAEAIARKWGRDPLDVEQELIDFFRDLSKKEFYRRYTEWKRENIFADAAARKRAMDEWMKQEQAQIEDEVVALLERGRPITEEWVWDNRKVYNELYKQLFPGREAPYSPGKKDMEAINAALMQEGHNASTYAEAYKVAREKAYGEFMSRISTFRNRVMQSKADAVKLQREALDFAEQNLPAEYRGEFARNIVSLLEYPTSPSTKYPEGRRMHEFRNLFDRIIRRAGEVRKETGVEAIREMLDAAKIKRNYKGIPTSVLPSEQGRVDRIRQVVNMNLPTLLNAVEYNNREIMNLEGDGEKENLLENYLEDNRILEMFGNLERRSPDEVEAAAKELEKIIKGGKSAFREAMAVRRAEVDAMRKRAVDDATFGKNRYADRGDAQKHMNYWLKNESLGTLMRIASGKSIQDFDNSIGGELYRRVEDSTQVEQTALRHMQQDLDAALRDLAGIGGSKIETMRKKGRFFRMIFEVVEHTGVFKTEYTRQIKTGFADYVSEEGRRGLLKKSIPVEDYEWGGKMRNGARSILNDIDNGGKQASFDGLPLDDVAVAFLRQQLADFDAGLKQSYEIFNDESDDANFNRMLEEERQSGRLLVFTHLPEEEAKTVEVPLSQGAALQILLTWEQEHYQPNMKWNGWTEESIRQLKKFIKPEVLKIGYWMRDTIARNKAALDQKVFERYGAHLPLNDKYFPAAFRGGKTKAVRVDSELGRGAGTMSINPNFLIARKFHLKPVDMDADAFSSFISNQIEQAHFLAWSDVVRDLKAVYGGTMTQKAIADNFGRAVVDNLVERVATIARGGGQFSGDYASRLFSKLYRYWVPAKIAINPSSIIKQMFGAAAYMNNVPVRDFVSYFAKANFSNPDYRAFVAWAKNTDYMKNRLAGGLDKDLSYLLNYTRDSKAYSPFSDALMNVGAFGTRWADAWSAMHGGYAAYMYALDQARKSGSTEREAREAARRAWMRATDETQQSGYLKDQNFFQSNQGAFRYLTAFMTNPIQVMNLQLQTINEIRYGADKKAAWSKLGRQILVNHFIVPTLMQFTTDMLRYGFNVSDWWDEAEFEDYLLAWVMGSFESAFLAGKLIVNIGDYALDRLFHRKQSFGDTVSAVPLAEDLKKDVGLLIKAADGEKELTEKDLMDGVKALGDVGMALGLADRRVGTLGALLHALGAQGKRVIRWFDDDRKNR